MSDLKNKLSGIKSRLELEKKDIASSLSSTKDELEELMIKYEQAKSSAETWEQKARDAKHQARVFKLSNGLKN